MGDETGSAWLDGAKKVLPVFGLVVSFGVLIAGLQLRVQRLEDDLKAHSTWLDHERALTDHLSLDVHPGARIRLRDLEQWRAGVDARLRALEGQK